MSGGKVLNLSCGLGENKKLGMAVENDSLK